MIQVFCKEVGAGKTKELISLANKKLINTKGDSVYIDKNSKYSKEIDRRIRFVSTGDYGTLDCESFYGLLCGIISGNYDVENIYIDTVMNSMSYKNEEMAKLFRKLEGLSKKFNLNFYINFNFNNNVPEFIKEYVA